MTALPDLDDRPFNPMKSGEKLAHPAPRRYALTERSWGYVIRPEEGMSPSILLGQAFSWIVGAAFLTAALGIWLVPGVGGAELASMKLGLTSAMLGVGGLALWFASRGTIVEVQIDTHRGEVRETVRNRTGRETVLSTHGFDSIAGVHIDDTESHRTGQLVLRPRGSGLIPVASGTRQTLTDLRDRIGRDLMVLPGAARVRHESFDPLVRAA